MRTTTFIHMENGDVPHVKITKGGDVSLIIDHRALSTTSTDIWMTPDQAEAIVNALVDALAALKVPSK